MCYNNGKHISLEVTEKKNTEENISGFYLGTTLIINEHDPWNAGWLTNGVQI